MTKYGFRLLVAILAFLIVATAIYLFAWDKIKSQNPYRTTHSEQNNSAYSIIENTTVKIIPYGASFEIPESWLKPNKIAEPSQNLYLSRDELNFLYRNEGNDNEEAEIINTVIPFENCVAHVGDRGWGNYLWNDLQGRVYITDLTAEEVVKNIETGGKNIANSNFEKVVIQSAKHGSWNGKTYELLDAPSWSDFMFNKDLDFYFQRFDNKTVVIVFLHADRFQKEIDLILNSFKWSKSAN
jgi:hypothetical protein